MTSWDANSGKSPEVLRHRLEALPLIAELGYAAAAKDVSNAEILGPTAILAENSGTGVPMSDLPGIRFSSARARGCLVPLLPRFVCGFIFFN